MPKNLLRQIDALFYDRDEEFRNMLKKDVEKFERMVEINKGQKFSYSILGGEKLEKVALVYILGIKYIFTYSERSEGRSFTINFLDILK